MNGVMMMNDEKRFCNKCSWNDCDYGCTCPPNEEIYQCDMYMHNGEWRVIIVEMQNRLQESFKDRTLFYSSRAVMEQG